MKGQKTLLKILTNKPNHMNQYILIQNDGEIETNSFELIGASTKRDEKGKIGFFGSGLKYSIAYMMRKGIDFKIFSGVNELKFTTVNEKLKGKDFDRICINGKETSFTVTMGPTWTEDWFILREIYCNALDEGSCTMVKETENVSPAEGKTRIYIGITPALKTVIQAWDAYFADERTPIFVSDEIYTCYLGHDDGGSTHCQKVSVYHKTNGVMYRRGIRVYKSETALYDYGFDFVNINEDRTAKQPHGLRYAIINMVATFADENYIKNILRTGQDDNPSDEYSAVSMGDVFSQFSKKWVQFSKDNMLVVKEISGRYAEVIQKSQREVFFIPSMFARLLKKALPEVSIVGMGVFVGDMSFEQVDKTAKMNYLLKEVLQSLKDMGYVVNHDIQVGQFEDEKILGHADIKQKVIYIADQTFDRGRREIATVIMEENEHIKSGHGDETKEFQNHIFNQWLKSMEEANGLFL